MARSGSLTNAWAETGSRNRSRIQSTTLVISLVLSSVCCGELVAGLSCELVTTLWTRRRWRNGVRTPPYRNASRDTGGASVRGLGGLSGAGSNAVAPCEDRNQFPLLNIHRKSPPVADRAFQRFLVVTSGRCRSRDHARPGGDPGDPRRPNGSSCRRRGGRHGCQGPAHRR